jgi:two-component system OmpR family response regulator
MNESKPPAKRVLVVEDDQPTARALATQLEERGYAVRTVPDGESALKAFAAEPADLVILDLLLPKLRGSDVLSRLRQQGVTVPVVVATNFDEAEERQRLLDLGVAAYFLKANSQLRDIIEAVERLLKV